MWGSRKAKEQGGAATDAPSPKVGPSEASKPGASPRDAAGSSATSGTASAQPANAEDARRRAAIATRQSVVFSQIVGLLMRSPHYKHYALSDLEWLVLPALATGQFSVAEAATQRDAPTVPVAVALWASVSPQIDKRLSEDLSAPMRLRPDEWRSGEILWLIAAVGDARMIPSFLKQLCGTAWKGRHIKLRRLDAEGKPAVALMPSDGDPQVAQ
jgi:hemolysin-activating ACP:hemolysin acyltransferase